MQCYTFASLLCVACQRVDHVIMFHSHGISVQEDSPPSRSYPIPRSQHYERRSSRPLVLPMRPSINIRLVCIQVNGGTEKEVLLW